VRYFNRYVIFDPRDEAGVRTKVRRLWARMRACREDLGLLAYIGASN
jgi:hypothetical protein